MSKMIRYVLAAAALCVVAASAQAAEFKSPKECTVGRRVATSQGDTGTITSLDKYNDSMCDANMDNGKDGYFLFWMLHDAGGSAETDDKLVAGKYACYSFSNGRNDYTFTDVVITGPNSYRADGRSYRYRLDAKTRMITFENGPFGGKTAKLVSGPSIDFQTNTTCDLQK